MPLRLDATGKTSRPFINRYSWRDYALYALGVGAGPADLRYLLDDPPAAALPTFGVVPAFVPVVTLLREIGGDLTNLLHNSQEVRNLGAWPHDTEVRTTAEVAGIWDMKVAALVDIRTRTDDDAGRTIAETSWQLLLRGEGGFGGPRPPALFRAKVPDGVKPVLEREVPTLPVQALLYRLSGDINPIHSKPEVAAAAGFDRPILHGLCTFGTAAREVLDHVLSGEIPRFAGMSGRFLKVVFPGDTLVVRAYEDAASLIVAVRVKERGEQVLAAKIETGNPE